MANNNQRAATHAAATPTPAPAPSAAPIVATAEVSPETIRTSTDGDTAVVKTAADVAATKGSYTVAPGRTVDGKAPGESVDLDKGDAERMLKLGFILDKDGAVVVHSEGPKVVAGAEIQER